VLLSVRAIAGIYTQSLVFDFAELFESISRFRTVDDEEEWTIRRRTVDLSRNDVAEFSYLTQRFTEKFFDGPTTREACVQSRLPGGATQNGI
jgi:hypothetical protein